MRNCTSPLIAVWSILNKTTLVFVLGSLKTFVVQSLLLYVYCLCTSLFVWVRGIVFFSISNKFSSREFQARWRVMVGCPKVITSRAQCPNATSVPWRGSVGCRPTGAQGRTPGSAGTSAHRARETPQ